VAALHFTSHSHPSLTFNVAFTFQATQYSHGALSASHSFRIGVPITAVKAGLLPWLIQTMGRWSSNCFTLYIGTLPSGVQEVSILVAIFRTRDLEPYTRTLKL